MKARDLATWLRNAYEGHDIEEFNRGLEMMQRILAQRAPVVPGDMPTRPPRNEYHIAFDTNALPGHILAVKITIEGDALPDDSAAPESLRAKYDISLVDHPLYPWLQGYVRSNAR